MVNYRKAICFQVMVQTKQRKILLDDKGLKKDRIGYEIDTFHCVTNVTVIMLQ